MDELSNNKVEQVLLTGGEPFLNKDIYFIIDELIKRGIEVSISTNGMLLLDNLKKLKSRKIKKIIVSLDTLDKRLYKRLRGKHASLNKVLNGIEKIKDNTNIFVTAHCVVNKLNINEVYKILDYANKKNIEFSISNLIPIGNKSSDDLVCTIDDVAHMLKSNNIILNEINCTCSACKKVIGIKANGTFTPCLWISNYTNKYDTYNICELESGFSNNEQDDNSCIAMKISKELNKQQEMVKSLTIKLN